MKTRGKDEEKREKRKGGRIRKMREKKKIWENGKREEKIGTEREGEGEK